jgi:hypothetical protein
MTISCRERSRFRQTTDPGKNPQPWCVLECVPPSGPFALHPSTAVRPWCRVTCDGCAQSGGSRIPNCRGAQRTRPADVPRCKAPARCAAARPARVPSRDAAAHALVRRASRPAEEPRERRPPPRSSARSCQTLHGSGLHQRPRDLRRDHRRRHEDRRGHGWVLGPASAADITREIARITEVVASQVEDGTVPVWKQLLSERGPHGEGTAEKN